MRNLLSRQSIFLLLMLTGYGNTYAQPQFADSHIHYNWDHLEVTSTDEIIETLKQHNVGLTILASTPSEMALEFKEKAGDWVIPFFSPYIHELGKRDWYLDEEVVKRAARGLEDGLYYGIGEVHFMNGFRPKTDNPIFLKLVALAREHKVPMMIHIDSGNEVTFKRLCQSNPDVKFIFAHAGGNLRPEHIDTILQSCANTWIDFAARDPWRYDGISKEDYTLKDNWKALVLKYPDRFITGTDPVWKVTRWSTWDTGDEGWQYYKQLYDYHWTWLNDLPEDVRHKVAWLNTRQLLGIE
jgi:hypothetical protein